MYLCWVKLMFDIGHICCMCYPTVRLPVHTWTVTYFNFPQVQCRDQNTLQGMMTPGARCIHLRAGITQGHLRMASLPMGPTTQASPLLPTPMTRMPPCSQGSQGPTLQAHTQDSLTPLGLADLATPVPLPCPRWCHPPYHPMCWDLVRRRPLSHCFY